MKINKKTEAGQSLFEALLALAVFVIAIAVIAHLFLGAHYSATYSVEKSQAVLLAKEGIEAVRSIRDDGFGNIEAKNDAGIVLADNKWTFQNDPDQEDKFTRKINISLPDPEDTETWQVVSAVEWTSVTGREADVSFTEHLTNWRSPLKYTLAIAVDPEEGGTAEDLTGEGSYEENSVVSIKATPEGCWLFDNWTATEDGGEFGNSEDAETTYTMPGNNVTVTANFIANEGAPCPSLP